jgi:hypothetical protein
VNSEREAERDPRMAKRSSDTAVRFVHLTQFRRFAVQYRG